MRLAPALVILVLPVAALAQGPTQAPTQGPARGPNGGLVAVVEGHGVELAPNGTGLVLHLTDEDGKPTQARAGARAVVQQGGRTLTVPLTPAPPNRLVGTLPAPLERGARVVVSATLADGHAIQARFVHE